MSTEIVQYEAATSIATSGDPKGALDFARSTATILKSALVDAKLTTKIQGKEHVNAEGWTLLAAMTNHTPRVAWCRKVDAEIGDGWEARVEVLNADGMVVSAAEAMALKEERAPWGRQEYACRSMAQTRATSKALKLRLGFIVALGGYATTPAEEMPRDEAPAPKREPVKSPPAPTDANLAQRAYDEAVQAIGEEKVKGILKGQGPEVLKTKAARDKLASKVGEASFDTVFPSATVEIT